MKAAARLAAPLVALAAVAAVAHVFGVAGWRSGFALVAVALAAVTGGLTFGLLRDVPGRAAYTAAAVLLAVVVAARLTELAPPSAGALAATLDRLPLPFYEQVSEERSGNGRCVPHCPVVRRTYRGPVIGEDAAEREAAQAIRVIGPLRNTRLSARADLDRGRRPDASDDVLLLTVTARGRRG